MMMALLMMTSDSVLSALIAAAVDFYNVAASCRASGVPVSQAAPT